MRQTQPNHRRRPVRRSVDLACQLVREDDFRLVADRIVDLSTFGLRVSPSESVVTGERLIVSFRLPRLGHWIDAEALVTRVIHGRREGEFSRALGLEFEYLRPYHRFLIRKELARTPPIPPSARPGRRGTRVGLRQLARAQAWLPTYAWAVAGGELIATAGADRAEAGPARAVS